MLALNASIELVSSTGGARVPAHVAIIMDGNGRWASSRGLPRLIGHKRGAERVTEIIRAAPSFGIKWLTLFAFSTENWRRSQEEVTGLMTLIAKYIRNETAVAVAEGVRMRFIGDRGRLDKRLRDLMASSEERTASLKNFNLTIAINYGARDEMARAARSIAQDAANGVLDPSSITEQTLSARLDTADLPDPDLIIRTSGENRVSNFLSWQAAYSEYAFTPTLWPDFSPDNLKELVEWYGTRERRFGRVST